MSVQTAIEPTPDQLAIIRNLEGRVRAIFLEIADVAEAIIALRAAGLETGEAAEAVAHVDNDALEELENLRISRGISAFWDWWVHRVRVQRGLDIMLEDIPDDDQGGDAVIERQRHRAALAVEQAIAKVDPHLVELLDRATPIGRFAPQLDPSQLQAAIGMTKVELEVLAAGVLTQLVDSGWRP